MSNVVSRVGFLSTLEETLGFTPKVDFNAGVVAAGEAQIESTVMGNASPLVTTDPAEALRDRTQVFLPTNNALSPVGHVYWYLQLHMHHIHAETCYMFTCTCACACACTTVQQTTTYNNNIHDMCMHMCMHMIHISILITCVHYLY